MSNVFKRYRKDTELQFMLTALDLQVAVTKYAMSDKKIPKKWRIVLGVPLVEKVDEMMDNITMANSIFPDSEESMALRRRYQDLAIGNCYQLHNKLNRTLQCVSTVTIENLTPIIDLWNKEVSLLKRWKKSDKIKKKDTTE